MTPQDYLKYAVDSLEGREPWIVESKLNELQKETLYLRRAQSYALIGILEHLISRAPNVIVNLNGKLLDAKIADVQDKLVQDVTEAFKSADAAPEPNRPVFDEHPKMAPTSTQQAAVSPTICSQRQIVYGDTAEEARAKAVDNIQEHNERADSIRAARDLGATSAGYGATPPPTSAKFRICMGCGTAHPMTTIGGRLVEHWHPRSLGDATINPAVCSQHETRTY